MQSFRCLVDMCTCRVPTSHSNDSQKHRKGDDGSLNAGHVRLLQAGRRGKLARR